MSNVYNPIHMGQMIYRKYFTVYLNIFVMLKLSLHLPPIKKVYVSLYC